MRAEHGKLRVDQSYTLESCEWLGGMDFFGFSCCDNCGKIISNVANVVGSEDKKTYHIGIDCAEVLTGIMPDKIKQAKKEMRNTLKFVKFLKTECKSIIIDGDLAFLYKRIVEEWNSFYVWRSSASRLDKYLDKLATKPLIINVTKTVNV